MKIIETPNAEGEFRIEVTKDEVELARLRALSFVDALDSQLVVGDRVKMAYDLVYDQSYFTAKSSCWSSWSRKWMEEFFRDSLVKDEVDEAKNTDHGSN